MKKLFSSLAVVAAALLMVSFANGVPQRSDYTFRTEVRALNDDGDVYWDTIVIYVTDAQGHTQQLYSKAQPLDTTVWRWKGIVRILHPNGRHISWH